MKHKLGSLMLENSLAYNIRDDEMFLPDGWITCDICGRDGIQGSKDRNVCEFCVDVENDLLNER